MNRLVDDLQTATRLSTGRFALQRPTQRRRARSSELGRASSATPWPDRRFSLERPPSRFRPTWTPTAWCRPCATCGQRGQVFGRGRRHRAKRLAGRERAYVRVRRLWRGHPGGGARAHLRAVHAAGATAADEAAAGLGSTSRVASWRRTAASSTWSTASRMSARMAPSSPSRCRCKLATERCTSLTVYDRAMELGATVARPACVDLRASTLPGPSAMKGALINVGSAGGVRGASVRSYALPAHRGQAPSPTPQLPQSRPQSCRARQASGR